MCYKNWTDDVLSTGFYSYLIQRTQLNGSLYRRLYGASSHTGVIWEAPVHIPITLEGRTENMRPAEIQLLGAKGQASA